MNTKTREIIMEAAGRLFAEEGFPKATVRDICRSAGVNIAAVNYHFGDKKGLYISVLKHYQALAFQAYPPDLGIRENMKPEEKLRSFIRSFLLRVMEDDRPAWFGKLLSREFSEPTWAFDILVEDTIRPVFQVLIKIVSAILDENEKDRSVLLGAMSVVAQCLYFRHSHPVITRLFPGKTFGPKHVDELTEHITRLSLYGLLEGKNRKKR